MLHKMTKPELLIHMRRVSDAMQALSLDMKEYGAVYNDANFRNHGIELSGAGRILANWQSDADKEENGRD